VLKGVKCGFKSTSCPDQLAIAVREAQKHYAANAAN
ncbi:MAG: TSCPD domain-containing protein, partial [Clostridia bacterium]|nr:TSCPD domain-containing protein [Clostridia bacterium]